MDFKAQLVSDMKVFHNCGEMANMYRIAKADCEDGEIILELEMLEE